MIKYYHLVLAVAMVLSASLNSYAVTVSEFFTNGMILQRDKPVKVWGWGTVGESVNVTFKSQSHNTTVASNGSWVITMNPEPYGGSYTLTVNGNNTLTYSDVLIGDVWLCMGQSNMSHYTTISDVGPLVDEVLDYPNLRMFKTEGSLPTAPQQDVSTLDSWVLTPNRFRSFSAIGYMFGRELNEALNIPIGLIRMAKGGTPIEVLYAPGTENYDSEVLRVYNEKPANFQRGMYYKDLYPSKNLAVAGIIYYQGENNALDDSFVYRRAQAALIQQLRNDWGADLPFGLVQLAGLNINNYQRIRESQAVVGNSIKNVGMVVSFDNVDKTDVHPFEKRYVGERLAAWALNDVYGIDNKDKKVSYLKDYTISGNTVTLTITNVGSGLVTNNGGAPQNFQVAGADLNFVNASAVITNSNTIQVSSSSVSAPVAVRYAFSNGPPINLFNGGGHAVSGFRTDTTPLRGTPADADVTPPSRPSSVSISGSTVSWTASTDDSGVEAYLVYVDDFIEETTTNLSLSLTGLINGQVVSVRARDHNFNISGISNEITYSGSGTPTNSAPLANAGSNKTLTDADNNGSESLTLDGTGSSDSDGTITSYEWSEAGVVLATSSLPFVTLSVGVHTVTLKVTDNDGATDTDVVVITVNAGSTGGGGSTLLEAENAIYSGGLLTNNSSASNGQFVDGNGSFNITWNYTAASTGPVTLKFAVASPSGTRKMGVFVNNGSKQGVLNTSAPRYNWEELSFTVNLQGGANTIELRDTEGAYEPDVDYLIIEGSGGGSTNVAPIANAGSNQTVTDTDNNGSESLSLVGTGSSDSDGSITSYEWSEGGVTLATSSLPYVTLSVGVHNITLTVTDDDGATNTDNVIITINAGTSTSGNFQQDSGTNGLVSMEAEDFTSKTAGAGSFTGMNWTQYSESNASGNAYMMVPDNGNKNGSTSTSSPILTFEVDFVKTGTHYLWVRQKSSNHSDNSISPRLGSTLISEWNMPISSTSWVWSKLSNSFTVGSVGTQSFHVYMREDGTPIDKIILTSNNGYIPSGKGARIGDSDGLLGSFSVYPNPAQGKATLALEGMADVEVSIYNLSGTRVVYQEKVNSSLDIRLKAGLYILKVRDGEVINTKKLVFK